MNIETEVFDYAEKKGLSWMATGGGCDFVYQSTGREIDAQWWELVLSDAEDGGMSPDSLECASTVTLYASSKDAEEAGQHWMMGVSFDFVTATDAIDWMAGFCFQDGKRQTPQFCVVKPTVTILTTG